MVILPRSEHNSGHELAREKLFFDVFLTLVLFPENSETTFILILPFKKNWNHKSCCQLLYPISTKLKVDKKEQYYFPRESRPFSLQKRLSFAVLLSPVKIACIFNAFDC